jgi:hypothetical protein
MSRLLPSTGKLAKASREMSRGPFEFRDASGPDAQQRTLWDAHDPRGPMKVTEAGRIVGTVLENCQWPYEHGGFPAGTLWACIEWSDPSAATSDDLAMSGRPIRLLEG